MDHTCEEHVPGSMLRSHRRRGREGEKIIKKNLARMLIATGCTVSMAMGCSPATPSSAVMLGTLLSTPR